MLNKSKIAKGCMDIAMPYLNERTQFGTKLADFQVSTEVFRAFLFLQNDYTFNLPIYNILVLSVGYGTSVRSSCN